MKTSEYPVWLAVMPDDREAAKKAAGRVNGQQAIGYDPEAKLWFARPGADLDRLSEWMPDPSRRVGGGDVEAQFLDALTQAGLIIKGMPVMDGNAHRVMTVEDKKGGRQSGVYRGFDDRRPGGWFINYHRASGPKDGTDWKATVGGESDPVTSVHIRAGARQAQDDTARTRAQLHAAKTLEAKGLYESFPAADPEHPYAVRKGITLTPDIRQTRNGALVVPFFNASGDFKTLQYILPTGDKLLFKDAPKQGHFLVVGGELVPGQPVLYAEGYATARSLNMALSLPVVMTIDADNMVEVAKQLKSKYPESKHLFMADFDHANEENKGLIRANQAAELVGGHVIYPLFTDEEKALEYSDFNDLHKSQGITAVSDQVGPVLLMSLMGTLPSNKEMQENAKKFENDKTLDAAPSPEAPTPSQGNKERVMQNDQTASDNDTKVADVQSREGLSPAYLAGYYMNPIEPMVSDDKANLDQYKQGLEAVKAEVLQSETFDHEVYATRDTFTKAWDELSAKVATSAAMLQSPPVDVNSATVIAAQPEDLKAQAQAANQTQPAAADAELTPYERNQLRGLGWTDEQLWDIPAEQARSALTVDPVAEEPVVAKATPAADELEQDEPAKPAGPAVSSAAAVVEDDARPLDEPVIPAQPAQAGSEKSSEEKPAEPDVIWVGAPRGQAQAELSKLNNVDLDVLRTRISSSDIQPDKSIIYKLDGEPAFIDRGMRLEMAEGASQSDEKILAALVSAADWYRGRIELTGSDAFKEKAIALIAQHEINVTMKVPDQQAMLVNARQALNTPAVAPDAVTGDSPPPYGPSMQAPAQPEQASTATGPVMDVPAAGKSESANAVPVAAADLSVSAPPRTVSTVPVAQADLELIIPVVTKADSTVQPPVAPQPVAQGGEANGVAVQKRKGVPPDIHQSTKAAKDGVMGKVMEFGEAPFQFKNENSKSTYIMLRTKAGTQTFWGNELAGLLRDTRVEQGSVVKLQWLGQKPVTIQVAVRDDQGVVLSYTDKPTHRNQWALDVLSNPAVRSGDDQGVKLMAYDANRFAVVQQALLSSLKLDVPLALPRDGLFWMSPNGEGSSKAGDALTAPRPKVDATAAGAPVMSSWKNGDMEAVLVRGDGPFLQGVVRQNDEYRNVLVSLPGNEGAPAMLFNAITEHGLVPIGSGNGINRSGGQSVSRENIAFRLDGDAGTRVGKLDAPAELPPNLHSRLGFDERYQVDSQLPKSAPVAAPSVHPNDPRPS